MSENDELDEEKIIETVKELVQSNFPMSNLNWTLIRCGLYLQVVGLRVIYTCSDRSTEVGPKWAFTK